MGQKLTVVVTCTERKSVQPDPRLRARDLPSGETKRRAMEWLRRLRLPLDQSKLADLYQGEAWTHALRIGEAAKKRGFSPQILVASAGLGLQPITHLAPSYAATFSPRHPDTVATSGEGLRTWWRVINDKVSPVSLTDIRGPAIVVMSDSYSRAAEDDLLQLGERNSRVTIFGGHGDIPGVLRISPKGNLRTALGGTLSSLNQRSAAKWLELLDSSQNLSGESHANAWRKWARRVAVSEVFDRRSLQDTEVLAKIRRMRKTDPSISVTRSLRLLRDSGHACEQGRFGRLFNLERGTA